MKVKAGQRKLVTPLIDLLKVVYWDGGVREMTGIRYAMLMISHDEMLQLCSRFPEDHAVRGMPTFFACMADREMWIYPLPEKDGQVRMRYFPPMKEI